MSEEVVRQTRSQKRALERDHASHSGSPGNNEGKRVKLEKSDAAGAPLALVSPGAENVKLKSEQAAKVAASILKSGEVKATIKLELQTGDEPVDMSTSKRWHKETCTCGYWNWITYRCFIISLFLPNFQSCFGVTEVAFQVHCYLTESQI